FFLTALMGQTSRLLRHRGMNKLNCSPKRAAISATHDCPKSVALRRRPRLALRAVVGDAEGNFDHGAVPHPCRAATSSLVSWRQVMVRDAPNRFVVSVTKSNMALGAHPRCALHVAQRSSPA